MKTYEPACRMITCKSGGTYVERVNVEKLL